MISMETQVPHGCTLCKPRYFRDIAHRRVGGEEIRATYLSDTCSFREAARIMNGNVVYFAFY